MMHLLGTGLEGGPVDDQARGHFGDLLHLDQVVGLQGRAAGDQIHDAPAKAKARRQFHGPAQLDALGLNAALGEVAPSDLRVLCGDAHVAPAAGIVAFHQGAGLGHGQAAVADLQVDRGIELRVVELHDHVVAGHAQVGRAKGHEGRHVEAPDPDNLQVSVVGGEAELARLLVVEAGFGHNPAARQERRQLGQNAAFGQGQHERIVRGHVWRSPVAANPDVYWAEGA